MPKKNPGVLLFADSEGCADMLYLAKLFVPDAFIALKTGRKRIAVAAQLEYGRLKRGPAFDEVLPLEEWKEKASRRFRKKGAGACEVIRLLAEEFNVSKFRIPEDFPAALAFRLKRAGVKLEFVHGSLFPEREIKNGEEAANIREGCAAAAAGLRAAEEMLRASAIRRGKLHCQNKILTSERLREAIETACLRKGAAAAHTIAAGGDQACDPHEPGTGPLRANDLIIVDVFPRVKRTGYYGDMTRTFLKGQASEEQKRLVDAVRKAQRLALKEVKAGRNGRVINRRVVQFFEKSGYETKKDGDKYVGFFHGLGHGLGLEIHERPRLSRVNCRLKAGHVVTVEPGLYYPGTGGCRIEDVVRLTRAGCEKLSRYPCRWRLPS